MEIASLGLNLFSAGSPKSATCVAPKEKREICFVSGVFYDVFFHIFIRGCVCCIVAFIKLHATTDAVSELFLLPVSVDVFQPFS